MRDAMREAILTRMRNHDELCRVISGGRQTAHVGNLPIETRWAHELHQEKTIRLSFVEHNMPLGGKTLHYRLASSG